MKYFGLQKHKKEATIENYLFLHRFIIKTLDIMFTGFKTGEYYYVPPDSILEGYYQYIHHEYLNIYLDEEINSWLDIKGIETTNLHMFRSLVNEFDFSIEVWNTIGTELLKQKKFLDSYVPHGAYVNETIKLKAYEMEEWLEEHKIHKQEVLNKRNNPIFVWNFIAIDTRKGALTIKDKEYTINPNVQEFVFLTYLIQNVGEIVHYKELASVLRLNANTENIKEDRDIARKINDVKKSLKHKLDAIKVPKDDSRVILASIEAITSSGYRLHKTPQLTS